MEKSEKIIATGRDTMRKAFKELKRIRDGKLYREDFKTFEEYCLKRWGLARSSAYQRLDLAEAYEALSAMTDKPTELNERQARALAGLPDKDKVRVWKHAVAARTPRIPAVRK